MGNIKKSKIRSIINKLFKLMIKRKAKKQSEEKDTLHTEEGQQKKDDSGFSSKTMQPR